MGARGNTARDNSKKIAVYHGSTVANDSCFTVGKLLTMVTLTVGIDVGQFLSIVLIIQCESKKSPCGLQFSDIFHKRLRILNQFFYTPINQSINQSVQTTYIKMTSG